MTIENRPRFTTHQIKEIVRDGYPAITLISPAAVAATYVPAVGMLCCSLTHHGDELLGQRDGIDAYVQDGATLGIPLLHPWANRLGGFSYRAGGIHVDVTPDGPAVHLDRATGLPIHGLVAGCSGWEITLREAGELARVEARLDATRLDYLMALFPFPHDLRMAVTLEENRPLSQPRCVRRATGPSPLPSVITHIFAFLAWHERNGWSISQ